MSYLVVVYEFMIDRMNANTHKKTRLQWKKYKVCFFSGTVYANAYKWNAWEKIKQRNEWIQKKTWYEYR